MQKFATYHILRLRRNYKTEVYNFLVHLWDTYGVSCGMVATWRDHADGQVHSLM
jgi:hypothetical protein